MQFKYILFSDLFDLIIFFRGGTEVRLTGEILIIKVEPSFIEGGVYWQ